MKKQQPQVKSTAHASSKASARGEGKGGQRVSVLIALNKLSRSELNVRKAPVDKEYRKTLKANLLEFGVMQPLIVCEATKSGQYEVGAGGNRLELLAELVSEGRIAADYLVPCYVVAREEMVSQSLSENIHAQMHPADEFQAYATLKAEGKSLKEIARAFGKTEKDVKKLLKLGGVAPEVLADYRAGEIEYSEVVAFAACDDFERQREVLASLRAGEISSYELARILRGDALRTDHPLVKFVGLAAYKKAGGVTNEDLFEQATFVTDRGLLDRLVKEKLETAAEQCRRRAWAWVESGPNANAVHAKYLRLQATLPPSASSLTVRVDELSDEILKLEATDDWTDEVVERLDALAELLAQAEAEVDAARVWTDEQRATSGCFVTVDGDGGLQIMEGLVLRGSEKAQAHPGRSIAVPDESVPGSVADYSQALRDDLAAYHRQSAKAALMGQNELAFELLVFTLAKTVMGNSQRAALLAVQARATECNGVAADSAAGAATLSAALARLPTAWLEITDGAEQFLAFQALGRGVHSEFLTYCVAQTLNIGLPEKNDSLFSEISRQLGFEVSAHWQPTVENFFGRISKQALLDIAVELRGQEVLSTLQGLKKQALAEAVASMAALRNWLPQAMRTKSV